MIDGFSEIDEISACDHEILIEFDQRFVPSSAHASF